MAYASVVSLTRTIELLLTSNSPMQSLICDHREEFLTLYEKVSSLEVCAKKFEKSNVSGKMTDFEAHIKEVADFVELTIQLRLTESLEAYDEMQKEKAHERLCDSLQQVAQEIDRVQKESTKIKDKGKQASNKPSLVQDSSLANVENNMLGRDDERKRLLEDLTRGFSGEPKVIPIVGMGGIGKTTLAKEVFDDVTIRSHFDVRSWATVSSQHNVKEILLSLLSSRKEMNDKYYKEDEPELADMLRKSLKGKRYLIVLDDIWKSKAWDDVRLCFPSENNGSRILLTTRDTEVACYAGTENLSLQMDFMHPDESWNLFRSAASANEALPSEFEAIGKQIVDKCQGLPLTIVVVAGILSKSERTIEDWENVAKDVKSFVKNDPDELCLHVLGLSYNHLTSDLKACLLYFGIFPEDSEISVKRLVRLWTAGGFLKLEKDLEGEAEKCLHDLIDRCLVLVNNISLDESKIKSCKVHDLIYELCLRELAESQNVFVMNDIVYVDNNGDYNLDEDDNWDDYDYLDKDEYDYAEWEDDLDEGDCLDEGNGLDEGNDLDEGEDGDMLSNERFRPMKHIMGPFKRRIEDDESDYGYYKALLTPGHHHLIRRQTDDAGNINLLKQTRSIFFFHSSSALYFTLTSKLFHFSLLRILDLSPIELPIFPAQILCLIWLRYLALSGYFDIPPEFCRLWNLQTFIASFFTSLPEQIWKLTELRHLELESLDLPNPPSVSVDEERYLGFSNIQTISGLSPSSCTEEVISGIRNVKKLRIFGEKDEYQICQESRLFDNLVHLHQLETLSFEINVPWNEVFSMTISSAKVFPATLKKLTLLRTNLRWEDLNIIGELPNLEGLKLHEDACKGEIWCPSPGGFTRLKLLQIHHHKIKYWKATNDSFPVLERLQIQYCRYLEEIPIEFAEIYSLQLVVLKDCKPKLKASAARIQQEQEDLGNKPVDVRFYNDLGTCMSSDLLGVEAQLSRGLTMLLVMNLMNLMIVHIDDDDDDDDDHGYDELHNNSTLIVILQLVSISQHSCIANLPLKDDDASDDD
ncbi:putative late blight resistance protein homolog R1A-3 isoform X3 [Nicotiana tomentosiformis]|uniref:putative late blight resistance protein homolog R1A-3 isoform X3 n=2 Tax=Nicotiana tomentosiformis TaxID=4098 RepID=UPI00051C450F